MSFLAKKQQVRPEGVPIVVLHRDLIEVSRRQIASSPGVETGGKLLGYIITAGSEPPKSPYGQLMATTWKELAATGGCLLLVGSISPGPRARRTATELLPDGEFQNAVFRCVESVEPAIEHLGTWHSHHPNGLDQFSSGDLSHYRSVVVDKNYGPDFFVAGLCVDANGLTGGRMEIFGPGGVRMALGKDKLSFLDGFPSLQPTVAEAERTVAGNIGGTVQVPLETALAKHFTIRERQVDSDSVSWVIADGSDHGFLGVVTAARERGGPVAVSLDVTGPGTTLHYDGPIPGDVREMAGRLLRIVQDLESAGRAVNRRN